MCILTSIIKALYMLKKCNATYLSTMHPVVPAQGVHMASLGSVLVQTTAHGANDVKESHVEAIPACVLPVCI